METKTQSPVEMTQFILDRKGCPLHYWSGGPEGRPLVIFTHGACVDHHSFDPHVHVVAEKYRVLTWDVRGHGLSQPMGEPLTIPLAVEDLLAIMDQLDCRQAALVSHSNGTYIAQEMVFRHPERVNALVIADGTCITWKRSAFDQWILNASGDLMALMLYERLKNAGLHYEPGYHIAQPMLLVHGDQDQTGDIKKIAPLWAAREPNCEYKIIPHARHFAILDEPGMFTELLMAFLEKNSG